MKKFNLILVLMMLCASMASAQVATTSVWATQNRTTVAQGGMVSDADITAGKNGVYNHLARVKTISLAANTGLTAYDKTSTAACPETLLGDLSAQIVPPFKMRIYNASTTPVIYRTIYSAPTGTLATATSSDGFVPFTSQVFEDVFFSVPNWTLSPSAAATLTVEIFTKGY